ncbi:MAG: hypothetical protein KDA81_18630 [Planctomycetaceae bacterium]|nr:hypothetical protein [Planctomycetaceae bacterium]
MAKRATRAAAAAEKKAVNAVAENATANKGGRPKGAKTQERAVATSTITLAVCPVCGSTRHKNRRLLREGAASGEYQGRAYQHYRHYTAECSDCSKALLVRQFQSTEKTL